MGNHVASKSPVSASVHEVPALALLLHLKSHGKRTDANRRHHLQHHLLRQNTIRLPQKGFLHFNEKLRKVGGGGPKTGSGMFGMKSPGDRKSTRLNSSHSQISYAV